MKKGIRDTKPLKPAKPPAPKKKQDREDIDRADSEGMAQPQHAPPKKRKR